MYNQNPEAFAHYEEGVRLGFIKKNPLTMTPEERYSQAEETARQKNAISGGNNYYATPDGRIMANKKFMQRMQNVPEMPELPPEIRLLSPSERLGYLVEASRRMKQY